MTPYSAADLLRTMRHAYGLPETMTEPNDTTPRAQRWFVRLIRRR